LRSQAEVERASQLDQNDLVWFYELKRFRVMVGGVEKSYTPDFWIVRGLGRKDLCPTENPQEILDRCQSFHIEDVKGWWGPRHKTYKKINAFIRQNPDLDFRIVVIDGKEKNV
jgi:hypothetical protein